MSSINVVIILRLTPPKSAVASSPFISRISAGIAKHIRSQPSDTNLKFHCCISLIKGCVIGYYALSLARIALRQFLKYRFRLLLILGITGADYINNKVGSTDLALQISCNVKHSFFDFAFCCHLKRSLLFPVL
jgi:hypothetical protein